MTPDARRRFGAITALVLGLFIGLTLLPIPITGPLGRSVGHALWQFLGAGALGIPLLGVLLALASFERLGTLDMKRVAVLVIGLSLLVPYIVGVVTHVRPADLDMDVADRGLAARAVGSPAGILRRDDFHPGRRGRRGAVRLPRALGAHPRHLRLAPAAAAREEARAGRRQAGAPGRAQAPRIGAGEGRAGSGGGGRGAGRACGRIAEREGRRQGGKAQGRQKGGRPAGSR